MADDGPPPLQGSDEEEELEVVGSSSGSDAEGSGEEEEEEEEEDDDDDAQEEEEESDDEAPPPMWGESGSEPEEEVPPPRPPPKPAAKKAAAASKKADTAVPKSSAAVIGKAKERPLAAAAAMKKSKVRPQKDFAVPRLWTAFAKSREGAERLGINPLKKWESFEKEGVSTAFTGWYEDQVLGNRSVQNALRIAGLPDGFPEFCHWVAAGNHTSCEALLKAGFEPFAQHYVKRVENDGRPAPAPVARSLPSPPRRPGAGRGVVAPGAEPVSGVGGIGIDNPKSRKRDRRARKGGGAANGTTNFAQKMQSAITELEGFEAGDDEGSAAATAARAGRLAEDEVRNLMRGGDVLEETAGDKPDPAFADTSLPNGTVAMLSHLKRAREYRRRANRQHECLENELERCLSRLARVERQYLKLVAETSGQEATLDSCLLKAKPLVDGAFASIGGGSPAQALDQYDDAIKLLEAHVEKAPAPGAGESESREQQTARGLLGVALCNRSVASYRLGDAYSGKRDAERAAAECPGPMAQEQLKRSQEYHRTLNNTNAASQWTAFPSPP
eukprot:g11452.t1